MIRKIARLVTGSADLDQVVRPIVNALNEVLDVPLVQAQLLENVSLPDNVVTRVKHGFGKRVRGWWPVDLVGATATGRIVRQQSGDDQDQFLLLKANGYGATITVSLMVFL